MHARTEKQNTPQSSLSVLQPQTGAETAFHPDHRPEATLQRKLQQAADKRTASAEFPVQKKANNTGLPDNLKSGIEMLSGYAMDDVKVHYNSDKPAQLQAHAYAQGTDIHLAPGQEQHLPHEAWHVVQQKQGRVRATQQLKGISVNDDSALEKEADTMGEKLVQMRADESIEKELRTANRSMTGGIVQRKIGMEFESANGESWKVQGQKAPVIGWNLVSDTKQPIYEEGNSFEVQGDRGHLEFVTKPHATWDALSGAVKGILDLMGKWDGTNFEQKAGQGNWKGPVGYTDYKLSCKGNLVVKPQANIGVPLSKIQDFFTVAKKSGSLVTKSLQHTIAFVDKNEADKIVAYAIEKYKAYWGPFYKEFDEETHNRLIGFVSELLAVIYQAYSNSGKGLEDPKYAFEMMPRTDFKAMKLGLGLSGWNAMNDWIKQGFLQEALEKWKIPVKAPLFEGGYQDAKKKHIKGPTREEWLLSLLSWPDNNVAKDLLSPPPGYPSHDDPTHQPAEGIGTMGMDGDLAVFELRDILNGVNKTIPAGEILKLTAEVAKIVALATKDAQLMPK